jgi:hypothetical protein
MRILSVFILCLLLAAGAVAQEKKVTKKPAMKQEKKIDTKVLKPKQTPPAVKTKAVPDRNESEPRRIPVKKVEGKDSEKDKQKARFGPASDSGPTKVLKKKNTPSPTGRKDLQKKMKNPPKLKKRIN